MAWASFANLIPKLPDFFGKGVDYAIGSLGGMPDSKARKNQIHDIRTLRRREYQDMVHSLTEAGLNPILAVGATPGHASAQMLPPNLGAAGDGGGVGSAYAANKQANVAGDKAPSEIAKNAAGTGLLAAQGGNEMLRRARIIQAWDINASKIEETRQNTRTMRALQEKYSQDAITGGASADKLRKDIEMLDKFGPPNTSWPGILRNAIMGGNTDGPAGSSAKSMREKMNDAASVIPKDGPELNMFGLPRYTR